MHDADSTIQGGVLMPNHDSALKTLCESGYKDTVEHIQMLLAEQTALNQQFNIV